MTTMNPRCANEDISVFYTNIRSLRKNVNDLSAFIAQQNHKFNILAIAETWLKKHEELSIPGYTIISNPRDSHSRGGGVALFHQNNLAYSVLPKITCSVPDIETLFIMIERSIIIGVVYRPPNSSLGAFLERLENIFLCITSEYNKSAVIVDDVNIDTMNSPNVDYTYLLESYNFRNLITTPTRVTSCSDTLIDHALTNVQTGITAGVYNIPISDHYPIYVTIQNTRTVKRKNTKLTATVDYDLVREQLLSLTPAYTAIM